jgi:hypothetical protein
MKRAMGVDMEKTAEDHARELTIGQRAYLISFYENEIWFMIGTPRGTPRGLVRRGLIGYAWGNTSQMGYEKTKLGKKVFDILIKGKAI